MYKDKDRQREADRARQKRRRDKIKAEGVTNQGVTRGVTDEGMIQDINEVPKGEGITYENGGVTVPDKLGPLNTKGFRLTVMERLFYRPGRHNFVSLPGRACHGVY